MPADLLPAWFPSDVLFIGLATLIVSVLVLNKGRWWSVNMLAMDEPIMVAAGVTIIAASGRLATMFGGGEGAFILLGGLLALLGVVAVYSDRLDFDVIG